jgi:cytochrome c biogenesis protein CcmG/thiol:disulfide interchange protein DsbE
VTAAVLVPLLVLLATQIGAGGGGTRTSRLLGKPVPAFDLDVLDVEADDLTGGRLGNADLAGTTYLVNFWNEWCVPCEQEHPALVEFHRRYAADPSVRLIGILRDERSLAAVRDYVVREDVTWTVLLDQGSDAAVAFGTTGQPETFAVGPDGVVYAYQYGPATIERLEEMAAAAGGGP